MIIQLTHLVIGIVDLPAAFLFIFGLKRMSSSVTAPSGIFVAGIGMLAAILASFLYAFDVEAVAKPFLWGNIGLGAVALLVGSGIAWWGGKKVAMTEMPQMIALYNGMGGGAAGAIAAVELFGGKSQGVTTLVVTILGALIGAISLSESLIAWAKLDEILSKPLRFKGQQVFNAAVLLTTNAVAFYIIYAAQGTVAPILTMRHLIILFFACARVFGVLLTLPIGGADMPVVISIYNSFEGFVLQNPALMIADMVVGAAALLLTLLMAKAMNRSVSNILFTNFGTVGEQKQGDIKGNLRPTEAADAGVAMRDWSRNRPHR
jgi:NAD(P) transhydrogenase subunit beta